MKDKQPIPKSMKPGRYHVRLHSVNVPSPFAQGTPPTVRYEITDGEYQGCFIDMMMPPSVMVMDAPKEEIES